MGLDIVGFLRHNVLWFSEVFFFDIFSLRQFKFIVVLNRFFKISLAMVDNTTVGANAVENSKIGLAAFECFADQNRIAITTEIDCYKSCFRPKYFVR